MGQNTAVQYISTKSFTVAVNSAKGDFSKVYMVQIKPYGYKWPVSRNDIWCPPYIYISGYLPRDEQTYFTVGTGSGITIANET